MANIYSQHNKTARHAAMYGTPQSRSIPGREAEMTLNNAGGVTFMLDDWQRLNRFLITGSEGGAYYVGEHDLTKQNADVAIRCIKEDGVRAVRAAFNINVDNRAPKTDQQLFVLALALKHGDTATQAAALDATGRMLRTGTHVLHFAAMLDSMNGWNRSKRRVIKHWFEGQDANKLAFQVLKYQQRDGWAMRDLLRSAHPKAPTPAHVAVYDWICGRTLTDPAREGLPDILLSYQRMQNVIDPISIAGSDVTGVVGRALLGIKWGLPREALPTEALADPVVLRHLLPKMPPHALLRNLGNLSAAGLFDASGVAEAIVLDKLRDTEALKRARVHPFAILLATLVYKSGRGVRGSKVWTVNKAILGALEDAYDAAFAWVQPTGKRILVAIDISGSMNSPCMGTPLSASTAASAMAITLARLEPHATVVQFDTSVREVLSITKRTGIASIESSHGGGTDVSSPVRWAMGDDGYPGLIYRGEKVHPQEFDAFVILTDGETWAGNMHTSQVLEQDRRAVNPAAKLICCSMAANHANIVDPRDPLSFGCAGLDANLPVMVAEFVNDFQTP